MRIVFSCALVLLLLTGMQQKDAHGYAMKVFPFPDTLVVGIDNEIKVFMDGMPTDELNVSIVGGSLAATEQKGVYTARSVPSLIGKEAQFRATHKGKVVIERSLPIVAFTGDRINRYNRLTGGKK